MDKYISCDKSKAEGKPYLTKDECVDCIKSRQQPCGLPGKIVLAMWGTEDKEPDGLSFSPTRIQSCLRAKYFEKRKADYDKIINPKKKWHALRGTISHSFLEETPLSPDAIAEIKEQRMSTTIATNRGPQVFMGKPDLVEVLEDAGSELVVRIVDWKSTREIAHSMVDAQVKHEKQINMYSYMIKKALPDVLERPGLKITVDELQIFYFTMSNYRLFSSKYQKFGHGKVLAPRYLENHEMIPLIPIEMKDDSEVEDIIATGIEDVIEATETLHEPLPKEEQGLCSFCPFFKKCWNLWEQEGR